MSTSKLQRQTGARLHKRFGKYGLVENKRPRWLVSSRGERLELDFFIDKLSVAVEVQGKQHAEFTPYFHETELDFDEQVRRDREKMEVCNGRGIELLYVEHKDDIPNILYEIQSRIDGRLTPQDWQNTRSKRLKQLIDKPPSLPPWTKADKKRKINTHEGWYRKRISKRLKASDTEQKYFDKMLNGLENALHDTEGREQSVTSKRKMKRSIRHGELLIGDGVTASDKQLELIKRAREKVGL